jgi:4'-phosphopantetheinyl transferase
MDDSDYRNWGKPPEGNLHLEAGMGDIWLFPVRSVPEVSPTLVSYLSGDERERARRYPDEQRAEEFVVSRGMLRSILARYLAVGPGEIIFRYTAHGKPVLAAPSGKGIEFNASHSGGFALVAVTKQSPVGIDIERITPEIPSGKIAGREFTPHEQLQLAQEPEETRIGLFFRFWTRKEAVLKGIGCGLSMKLHRVDVSRIHSGPDAREGNGDTPEGPGWYVGDIETHPGYAAAVAVSNPLRRYRLFEI